ncbi:ATP-binding protein [Pacificimonas sp. ICDLI1SI03]
MPSEPGDDSQLRWSRRWSLTTRILAVNLFAVLMLAGGVLYLDSFRVRQIDQRVEALRGGAALIASSLGEGVAEDDDAATLRQAAAVGRTTGARVRIYGPDGTKLMDNWDIIGPTYTLIDPATEPWRKNAARFLDRMIDALVGARRVPRLDVALPDRASTFPEIEEARRTGRVADRVRLAPDRTPVTFAAAPLDDGRVMLLTQNARDVTTDVRSERATLFLVFLGVLGLSLLLSSFLARTIVRPLRRLAIAAQRVRLGRARDVTVPRFQLRRDEIGELARSLSDMTTALRMRIDATEAFAADVAHEIKNPLASLRSAVEGMGRVEDPQLRQQLLAIVTADVDRIDRLISDISNASRLDAELSRTRFEPVDLGNMLEGIVGLYEERGLPRGIELALARPAAGTVRVMGDPSRLAQIVRNLIDNAISFSPDGGLVQVSAARGRHSVVMRVEDRGPGIRPDAEEKIFQRFYSERPEGEDFGQHSGLGLAICRSIVEAHDGKLNVETRKNGGARFIAKFPAAA